MTRRRRPVLRPLEVALLTLALLLLPAGQRIARAMVTKVELGAKLTGTVVLQGGSSYAFFRQGSESWRVREGQEVREGVRLLEVKPDCVVVEQGGARSTVRFSWVPEPGGRGVPRASFRHRR